MNVFVSIENFTGSEMKNRDKIFDCNTQSFQPLNKTSKYLVLHYKLYSNQVELINPIKSLKNIGYHK